MEGARGRAVPALIVLAVLAVLGSIGAARSARAEASTVLWRHVDGPWGRRAIVDLDVDPEGRLLVLTREGLWRGDENGGFRRIESFDGSEEGSTVAEIVPETLDVWAGHEDRLCRWRAGAWTCFPVVPFEGGRIAFNGPDDGWAACDFSTMHTYRFDGERWAEVIDPLIPIHASNRFQMLVSQGPDQVWLAGTSTALVRHDGVAFRALPRPGDDGRAARVTDVCAMSGDRVVALTDRAWLWDGTSWSAIENGRSVNRCATETPETVWLFGEGGRIARFDGREVSDTPSMAPVARMVFDGNGGAWAARGSRLLRRTPGAEVVFRDVAATWGIADVGRATTARFLELDGDGRPDLLLLGENGPRLLRNRGGADFEEVTEEWDLARAEVPSRPLAVCDLDGDGRADLVGGRDPPDGAGEQTLVYLRHLRGRFEDVTATSGLAPDGLRSMEVRDLDCIDLDRDGDLDLYVTVTLGEDRFPTPNVVFENTGHGRLRRRRLPARGLGGGQHWTRSSEFVDLLGDRWPELISANIWNVGHAIYARAADGGRWDDVTITSGIGLHYGDSAGSFSADLDGDGWFDLLVDGSEGARLYRNDGGVLVEQALPGLEDLGWSTRPGDSPPAADDVDGDGDLDLLLLDGDSGARLLLNDGGFRLRDVSAGAGLTVGAADLADFADIDGDGDLDILLIGRGSRSWMLLDEGPARGRRVTVTSSRRAVAGADVRLVDGDGALVARRTVPQDGSAVALPPPSGEPQRLRLALSDGTEIDLDAPVDTVATVHVEGGAERTAALVTGALARRMAWTHRREAALRGALLWALLALASVAGRRRGLLRLSRPAYPIAAAAAVPAMELAVAGLPPAWRWGTGAAALALIGAATWLDLRATRLHRATWVAHFRILGELGTGGMGTVYRALDSTTRRTVALKVLRPELARTDDARRRFQREAELGAAIEHPNVVRIYEHGQCMIFSGDEARRTSYLSMELVDGRAIRALIEERGTVPLGAACRMAVSLLGALQALHDAGVVHRDIKPDNVMLTERGVVKLTDFGLARGEGFSTLTRSGNVMGTINYMPPEQAETGRVDERADIYATGVLLYELLSGRRPFVGDDPMQVLFRIFSDDPAPLDELRPGLPAPVVDAVRRAMARDPDGRFPTAEAFAAVIRPYADPEVTPRSLQGSRSTLFGRMLRMRRRSSLDGASAGRTSDTTPTPTGDTLPGPGTATTVDAAPRTGGEPRRGAGGRGSGPVDGGDDA